MENKVLAKVNGHAITQADVNTFMERLGPQRAAQFQSPEGQQQILNELINQNLFFVDATANNLHETPEFQAEMDKMKAIVLTQINVTNVINSVAVNEEEVVAYYNENKENFGTPATADTSHILVDTEELANEIRTKILNNEMTFEDAAKEYSSCPSGQNGGTLGSYPKGQMVPEYDNASFAMNEGELSQPVETQFGFHLIRLNGKTVAGESSFEDVKQQVETELLSEKQRNAYMDKVSEMHTQYNVEIM
jgi:peptidyl-prolyl cis-trans isomerase C